MPASACADARPSRIGGAGENPIGRFTESLRKAGADQRVRALVVRINSPGGTVTASDVMYRELMQFKRDTGKPVVILMAGVAASGGYYLACAGDTIIAHPTTITGSVGVIMQTINVSAGMQRIGIAADAITSGRNKAVASPLLPMSPEHRALLQGIVNEFYANFLEVVRESRPALSESDFQVIGDGRVVTGAHAAEIGLVDRTGDLHDAFAAAKELAKITTANLVKYHRPVDYVGSAFATAPANEPRADISVELNLPGIEEAGFYYLWDPAVW